MLRGVPDLLSICVATGQCPEEDTDNDGTIEQSTICVSTGDCEADQLCCGVDLGVPLPVDVGACTLAENNCQVQ
jgi:hypothetical protein